MSKASDRTTARNAHWSFLDSRNDDVRRRIRAGDTKANVMHRYGLSETAYEQLAGQARS